MSADAADSLRRLARDHLEGDMSVATYRRLRAPLLDGLMDPPDTLAAEATQPRPAPPRIAAGRPEPARALTGSAIRRIAGSAALAFLVVVAVVLILWWRGSSSGAAGPAGGPARHAGSASQAADPIRALVEPLLHDAAWSDARLGALDAALRAASPAEIAAARHSDWFEAFVDVVRSRVRQQQALAGGRLAAGSGGTDTGTGSDGRASPLAALAQTLGIDLAVPNGLDGERRDGRPTNQRRGSP